MKSENYFTSSSKSQNYLVEQPTFYQLFFYGWVQHYTI